MVPCADIKPLAEVITCELAVVLFAPDIDGEPNATKLLNPVIKTFVVGDISTLLREKVAACPVKFIFASPTRDIEPTDEVMAKELRETFTEAKSPPKELNGLSANAVIPNII